MIPATDPWYGRGVSRKGTLVALLLIATTAGCTGAGGGGTPEALVFPDGFLWGTATAAHQVEGGNTNNDWWAWEQMEGTIAGGDVSGDASDHYARFDEDFALAAALGNQAHRFSIEWSRIEPERDVIDADEVAHYHAVLDSLEEHGLQPVVTLSHFTSPLWVSNPLDPASDLDGWLSDDTRTEFAEFAGFLAAEYGDQVDLWVTFNEPLVSSVAAANDSFPPGAFHDDLETNIGIAAQWVAGMLFAHGSAYDAIRLADAADADGDGAPASVGIAQHMVAFAPLDETNPAHVDAAEWMDQIFNRLFVDAVVHGWLDVNLDGDHDDAGTTPPEGVYPQLAGTADWLGLNYYRRLLAIPTGGDVLRAIPQDDPDLPSNELGWSVYPEGMLDALRVLDGYGLPILITENGTPDADDDERGPFLVDHLVSVHRAIEEGADVRGYFHWSLIDNFEWAEGFEPRFGLVAVDYSTQQRTPRSSYDLYAAICTDNALSGEIQRRHRTIE